MPLRRGVRAAPYLQRAKVIPLKQPAPFPNRDAVLRLVLQDKDRPTWIDAAARLMQSEIWRVDHSPTWWMDRLMNLAALEKQNATIASMRPRHLRDVSKDKPPNGSGA